MKNCGKIFKSKQTKKLINTIYANNPQLELKERIQKNDGISQEQKY